jgi:outer membrane receptor protein involved in Fe transport
MKTLFLLLISTFFIGHTLYAQQNVKGVAKESQNPVPFATVAILHAKDSSLVKANYSNENGTFAFNGIENGKYLISITGIGYKKFISSAFEVVDKEVDLGILQVSKETSQLDEVVVTTKKPLVEVLSDKTVFNVSSNINAAGQNALEILRKAPGVSIDNNNRISVQGKNTVTVYIDGRQSVFTTEQLAQYLKTMQASDIEAIEIITQPSAKYDAAGNAGIINIRLKKNTNLGTNGSVNVGIAQGSHFAKFNGSLALNHRTKKLNLFGNYTNNTAKNYQQMTLYRIQNGQIFNQTSETINDELSHNLRTGADYTINSKNTLGVIFNYVYSDNTYFGDGRNRISNQATNIAQQVLLSKSTTRPLSKNISGNLNYRYADTTGTELNFDANIMRYDNSSLSDQPNTYTNPEGTQVISINNFAMNTQTTIDLYNAKVDYERKLWGGKFSTGAKFSLVKTDNDFNFYDVANNIRTIDLSRSNLFSYRENVSAAYFSYKRKAGKWDFQAGLRAENTVSQGKLTSTQSKDPVNRDYLDFFPSAGITYNANPKNAFGLTYSRRIDRPNYQSLNPFENKLDELTFERGNPFLKPQYTNSVAISHTYAYAMTTALSYSYTTDFFAQLTDIDENNPKATFISPRNLATERTLNLNISVPIPIKNWWMVYANLNMYNSLYDADFGKDANGVRKIISQNVYALNFYGQNTFTLPKGWTLEVSGWYNSPSVWAGVFQTNAMGSLDLGLQKTIMKEKGTIRISATDVLFTSPWAALNRFGGLYMDVRGSWESRLIKFNFTYNFGNTQMKANRSRDTGSEDEAKRLQKK